MLFRYLLSINQPILEVLYFFDKNHNTDESVLQIGLLNTVKQRPELIEKF